MPFNETDIKGTNDYYNLPIDSLIQGYIYLKLLYFRSFTFGKVSISAGIPEAV